MSEFHRESVSNGHPDEQALIRRWWHEQHGGAGCLIWEYHLGGFYADAIWLVDSAEHSGEHSGLNSAKRFPLDGKRAVLCEAKLKLTPELIGQALVYSALARRAGAELHGTVVFAESATPQMRSVASELGLDVVVTP